MWWMIPAATAAIGAMSAKNKNDQTEAYNKGQAELTRYSPWTGMQGQLQKQGPSMMEGAFAGGLQGLGMAQGLGMGPGSASPAPGGNQMMAGTAFDQMQPNQFGQPNLFSRTV